MASLRRELAETVTAVEQARAELAQARAPDHQLCCGHARRKLQAVADAAPHGQWCWATQAAEALTAMQQLARDAISHGHDAVDPATLAAQARLFRSAVLAGASQTAARSGPLMKSTTPSLAAYATARTITCASPATSARRPITTVPSATSGWPR